MLLVTKTHKATESTKTDKKELQKRRNERETCQLELR